MEIERYSIQPTKWERKTTKMDHIAKNRQVERQEVSSSPTNSHNAILTHSFLETRKKAEGKQCRPRPDAT